LKTRIISGAVLVAILLLTIMPGGYVTFGFTFLISIIGLWELYRVIGVQKTGIMAVGVVSTSAYYASLLFPSEHNFPMTIAVVSMIVLLFIYVFTYPYYDKNNWPSSVVVKLLGEDIPHLPENDYEYDAMLFDDEEGNIAKIIVYGAGYDEFYAYFDFFKAAGFLLPDPKLDANGKPVLDSDGNEIYEPKVDDDGNEYFLILEYNFKYGVRFYYDLNTYYALVIEIYSIFPETNN